MYFIKWEKTMLDWLNRRLEPISKEFGEVKLISGEIYTNDTEKIVIDLYKSQTYKTFFNKSIQDVSDDETRNMLSKLPILLDAQVNLVWASQGAGIIIPYLTFIKYFDDLWYPGSDDIWIYEDGMEWILEISHEEKITFYIQKNLT
jgi:hypothetical protein